MKNLLRTLALTAGLALAAFSSSPVTAATLGTCQTFCIGSSGVPKAVTWTTTSEACCGGTVNPCPPGTTPAPISWNGRRCAA